jgi:hypothetical protein
MRIFVLLSLEGKIDTVDSLQHCIVYIHCGSNQVGRKGEERSTDQIERRVTETWRTGMFLANLALYMGFPNNARPSTKYFPGTDAAVSGDLSFPGKIYNVNEIMKEAVQDVLYCTM